MSKPILIIQLRPEDETSNNEFEAIMRYGKLTMEQVSRVRAEQKGLLDIKLEDYSAIIVGGSPFDVSKAEHEKSAIQKQIETEFNNLFVEIIAQDFPFLGACSGNGLLGAHLGTPISGKYSEPVTCRTVSMTREGRNDPLLEGYPEKFDVLLGHKEACDEVPSGATLLLKGEACPVQMFRLKQNVYATQFHPEGDAEGFILRVDVYKHHGYFNANEAEELKTKLRDMHTPYAQEILARFVKRYLK